MSEGGDIFRPTDIERLREAEILALRQMSASLAAVTQEMVTFREVTSLMREDIAIIKTRQEHAATLKEDYERFQRRLETLEDRNLKQDGAVGAITFLKDFGPWVVSLILLAWGFLVRRPG